MTTTADIKVNMGVTGVAQFKQAMTQGKAAVKSLDAELKLNEAQYKASGNAEDYMRQKTELLKKQITEQEKVVKAAEDALEAMVKNGVNPADKAFTQMKTNLAQAQTQLVNMQSELKGVGDAGKSAASDTDKLAKSVEGIGKNVSLSTVTSGIQGITNAAKTAVQTVGNLGQAIWGMTTASAAQMDDYATQAAQQGIDRDLVIRMNSTFVKGTSDLNPDDIFNAMNRMARQAENGVVDLGEGWQFSLSNNRLEDFFRLMNQLEKLDGKPNGLDKVSVMERVFGKSFTNINHFDYDKYMELLESVDVIDEESVDNLLGFQDALDKMNGQFETFKQTVSGDLAGGFTAIANAITTVFESLTEWARSEEGKEALNNFATNIAGIVENFANTDWTAVTDKATSAINGVVSALEWFKDNQDTVTSWLTGIAGAFAVFETAKGFLAVAKVVEGFAGLGGASGLASAISGLGSTLGTITLTAGTIYLSGQLIEHAPEMAEALDRATNPFYKNKNPVTKQSWDEVKAEAAAIEAAKPEYKYNSLAEYLAHGDYYEFTANGSRLVTAQERWDNLSAGGIQAAYDKIGIDPAELALETFGGIASDLDDEVEEVTFSVTDLKDCINEGVSILDYFTRMVATAGQNVLNASAGNRTVTNYDSTAIGQVIVNGASDPAAMYREIAKQGLVLKAGFGS